jgi:hypothetical protein
VLGVLFFFKPTKPHLKEHIVCIAVGKWVLLVETYNDINFLEGNLTDALNIFKDLCHCQAQWCVLLEGLRQEDHLSPRVLWFYYYEHIFWKKSGIHKDTQPHLENATFSYVPLMVGPHLNDIILTFPIHS